MEAHLVDPALAPPAPPIAPDPWTEDVTPVESSVDLPVPRPRSRRPMLLAGGLLLVLGLLGLDIATNDYTRTAVRGALISVADVLDSTVGAPDQ